MSNKKYVDFDTIVKLEPADEIKPFKVKTLIENNKPQEPSQVVPQPIQKAIPKVVPQQ